MAENDRIAAIAAFDADYAERNGSGNYNGIIAVIDLDQWIGGICKSENGNMRKISETSTNPVKPPIIAENILFTDICGTTYGSIPEGINEKLKKYIKLNGTRDQSCCIINGTELNCSTIMEAYNNSYAEKVGLLTERTAELVSKSEGSLNDIRIVVSGRISTLFCTYHTIKSHLGSSPFLPDRRFAAYADNVDPAKMAELGSKLLDKNSNLLNRDVIIVLKRLDENHKLQTNRKFLGHRETTLKDLETPSYIQPFAVVRNDRLNIMSENITKEIALPDEVFSEGEIAVIQIALITRNKEFMIRVKRSDNIETDIRIDI